jgi:hypothetical protein
MKKPFAIAGLLSCAALVLGCPKKTAEEADAAAEASVAADAEVAAPAPVADAAPAPVAVTAKNSAEVARYAAETAVADDDAKLGQLAPARTSPKSGAIVATLAPGSDITKLAEYQGSVLATFPDPKDPKTTLMGWIGKEAFTAAAPVVRDAGVVTDAGAVKDAGSVAPVDAGAAKLACSAGMVPVIITKDPVCKKKCAKDADCKGGAAGACATANQQGGGLVRVCASE